MRLFKFVIPSFNRINIFSFRDLPEPIFTNELLIRFEEAGAILNLNTREKHLKILVDNLPPLNKLLLSWLIMHLHSISLNVSLINIRYHFCKKYVQILFVFPFD